MNEEINSYITNGSRRRLLEYDNFAAVSVQIIDPSSIQVDTPTTTKTNGDEENVDLSGGRCKRKH